MASHSVHSSSASWKYLPEDIKIMIIRAYCTGLTKTTTRTIRPIITLKYSYLLRDTSARTGTKQVTKGGITTQHTPTFPHNPTPEWRPLPVRLDRHTRDVYTELWPVTLRPEDSRQIRFHPNLDVIYMAHNQLYTVWDFCKKYLSPTGPGYRYTNGYRLNNASKFQNTYTLPNDMEYEEIERFDKIERLATTLTTCNMRGTNELQLQNPLYDIDQPLKSIHRVKFNYSIAPEVSSSWSKVISD